MSGPSLEDWWPSLLFGPIAVIAGYYAFTLQRDGQHDVNVAICRSDLQALHALEHKDRLQRGSFAPDVETLLADNTFPGPVLADSLHVELLPEQSFLARVHCVLDGQDYVFEMERDDKRVRRR